MNDKIYTPGMKTKRGEMRALGELSNAGKLAMLPLIDLLAIPDGADAAAVQLRIDKSVNYLTSAWPSGHLFYMDLFDVAPGIRGPRNSHPVTLIFRALRDKGFRPIPVVGLDRDAAYLRAVRDVLAEDGELVCVRLQEEDFLNPGETATTVSELLENLGAANLEQHVIFDFRSIENSQPAAVLAAATNTYQRLSADGYVRFVFLASSMPSSLSFVGANSVARVSRREIFLWEQLRQATRAEIVYGDYGVVHPDYVDLDPRLIKPAAKIRYSFGQGWVVVKGTVWRTDTGQFRRLAATVMRQPGYRTSVRGWGEEYLRDCAAGKQPSSTLERWVSVDTNTHLELSVRQVSRVIAGARIEEAV